MQESSLSLSLSRRRFHPRIVLFGVFLFCACVGIIAGSYIKYQTGKANAASENITVVDNNQVVAVDQSAGTQTITRTSTMIVEDTETLIGYTISAKLSEENTLPNATVTIGSNYGAAICRLASPCTLTTIDQTILSTSEIKVSNSNTITWTIAITIPANTPLGNYILDIEYLETPRPIESMQSFSVAKCNAMATGTTVKMYDERDRKVYNVKKMPDNRCWMVDNLAYDINSAPIAGKPAYNPTAQLVSGYMASTKTQAQYARDIDYEGDDFRTEYGDTVYLYNWCAALGDTSTNCSASASATNYTTVVSGAVVAGSATSQPDVTGICPAPFRLPKSGRGLYDSTASNTANEFAKLDIALGGTGSGRQWDGVPPAPGYALPYIYDWDADYGGFYRDRLYNNQGLYGQTAGNGYWWSSTANDTNWAYHLDLYGTSSVYPGVNAYKEEGNSVRCLI